jgi:hypothetical protein
MVVWERALAAFVCFRLSQPTNWPTSGDVGGYLCAQNTGSGTWRKARGETRFETWWMMGSMALLSIARVL